MRNSSCRIPSLLDRQFAREHSANEFIIANLRGLYETRTKDTIDSIDDYLTKLLPFKNKLVEEDKKAINDILNCSKKTVTLANVTKLLKRDFTDLEIKELTELIYSNFTDIISSSLANPTGKLKDFLDEMNEAGKHYSRADVIRAIGIDSILVSLVNSINSLYYNPKKATYMNPLLGRLIEGNHIDTFLWLARDEIYRREGIKFGRKIKYVVEFTDSETLEADYKVEDSIKDGWMREMEKESPFKNIGQEVRAYLGRQILYYPTKQSVETVNPRTGHTVTVHVKMPQTSKNGFRRLHNMDNLHKSIQNLLTGCRDMNHMLEILGRAAKGDINMQNIYNDLMADPQLAAAFYRDFKKTKCNYTKAFYNRAKRVVFQVMRSSVKRLSYYHYSNSFTSETNLNKTIFKNTEDGVAIHGDKINDFRDYVNDNIGGNSFETITIQSATVTAEPGTEDFERQAYMAAKQLVETISDRLGLNLTNTQIENLVKSKINLKSFLADAKALANDKRMKADTLLEDASSIFKDRISAMLNNINDSTTSSTKSVRIGDSTYFTDIVTSKIANTLDIVKSFAADAKYALSLDNLEEQNRLLEEVVARIKEWVMTTYGCSSEYYKSNADGSIKGFYNKWVDLLYNTSVEGLKDLDSFIYHFNYDRAMLFDGILAEDFSADLDLKTFIVNYFSNDTETSSGYGRYPVFTTGDSLALKFITARKYGYNALLDHFVNVAQQEIARMQLEAQVKETLDSEGYDTGKIVTLANKTDEEVSGDFIYLKFLNRTDVRDANNKTYKERIREALKNDTLGDVLTDILKKELFEEYQKDFLDKIKNKEIFASNEDGTFKDFPNYYGLSARNMEEDTPSNGLMLYYLNTKLAYIYQYQFLGANPAAYGLSTAMQKRYKAYNAPGNAMNVWAKDYNGKYYIKTEEGQPIQQKVKYFKDTHTSAEETDPAFMESLAYNWGKQALGEKANNMSDEEIMKVGRNDVRYKMYLDNDVTDGQGFRVLDSYRRVMGMAKQWTEEMDNAYNIIQDIRKNAWDRASKTLFNKSFEDATADEKYKAKLKATLTADEIDSINALDVVFQPIKPHTCTVEKVSNGNGDVLLVPVEHKYAEALIIPELFPENSFRKMLGVEMEEKGIDLSCSEQCVKVGCFGAANLTESNKGQGFKTTAETFAEEFGKGYTHTIEYSDYTIQTNVPEHINASQLFGTQLRKHVFDAIKLLQAYNYGGVEAVKVHGEKLNFNSAEGGKAFLKFYNALICENMNSDLIDLSNKLSDTGKLSDLLTELKGNDFNSSLEDIMRFSLDEDGNFVNPICEPSGMYDIESILTSIFKREVNKQHINGGSCVQVSDYGISNFGTELKVHVDAEHNITTVDCAMAWDLSWTDAQGNKVPLKFSDYCNADGTLIMETRVVDGKEVTKEKIEWDYEGILDLVAYRIPTEREYSVINLRVKKFLPKVMGGIIMVPSQYVTVAGFDFDIDKLYYFRKEFKQKEELSPEEVTEVWNDIYGIKVDKETGEVDTSNSSEIYKKLKDAHDAAVEKYRTLREQEGEYTTNSIGSEEKAASLKKALGLVQEEKAEENPIDAAFKPKDRLYKYWEEAGLQEETGMSYTEYYNNYLTKHKNRYIKFEEYNYSKDVTENSVVARNNELIKCIQSRLVSPDTFNARYTPGGFTNAKRDKRVIKAAMRGLDVPLKEGHTKPTIEDYENYVDNAIKSGDTKLLESLDEALDVTNVLTTAEYNAKNRVAAKVIGIMANHNTNAVYSKAMGSLTLREPIEIFGYKLFDLNNSNTGRDYMLTLAELLASSVDAVKDPVLGDLMINSYTANVAALLARLGLSTEEIGLFLNQPIIREVCDNAINKGDSSISNAIRRVAQKYDIDVDGRYSGSNINKNDLFNSLNLPIQEKDVIQGNILNAFSSIANAAQALSDFISKTKYTAANSIDNTIGGLLALVYDNKAANEQETSINKYLIMSFSGFSSQEIIEQAEDLKSPIILRKDLTLESMQKDSYKKFLDATPFAFEQMVHDAVRAYIKKLSKFFPYTTDLYENVYDTIYSNIIFGQMDQDIMDAINRQLPVYILSSREGSQFNPDGVVEGDNTTNKYYYTVDFPRQLRDFLEERDALKNAQDKTAEFNALKEKYSFLQNTSLDAILENDLLDKMSIEEYSIVTDNLLEDEGIRFNITIEEDGQFDRDIKSSLIAAWDSLVADKDLKVNNARESLAHALFMYNFHTRGYEVGRNAFSNITPLSVKDTLLVDSYTSYSEFYNKLVEGSIFSINAHRFIPLFYANNIDNNKLIKAIYGISSDANGTLTDPNLPSGRFVAKFGEPVEIVFDAGSKQNYAALTLPPTKRSGDMKNKRILVPAFKIVDKFNDTRLFVLKPNALTDGFNFADSQYNVRNVNSRVSYIEVPVKGINNTTVDYSMEDINLLLTIFKDTALGVDPNSNHEPYVEPRKAIEVDPEDEEAVVESAIRLLHMGEEESKKANDC